LLIGHRFFSHYEIGHIQVRFCSFPGEGRGLTTGPASVFIDDAYSRWTLLDMLQILAHEFYHARDWQRLGDSEFKCKYVYGFRKGGINRSNPMEEPAYLLGERVVTYFRQFPNLDTWTVAPPGPLAQEKPNSPAASYPSPTPPPPIQPHFTQTPVWSPPIPLASPRVPPQFGGRCLGPTGWCAYAPALIGSPCQCRTPYGVFLGRIGA
jgi:hypothetical protein